MTTPSALARLLSTSLLGVRFIAAQTQPAPVVDSTFVDYVQEMLVEKAAPLIVRAARDTSSIALVLRFPSEDPTGRWGALQRVLMRSAHGRPVRRTDSLRVVLALSEFTVRGDTLRTGVTLSWEQRCGGPWMQTGYTYTRRLLLRDGWSKPLEPEEVLAFDSFGCLPP